MTTTNGDPPLARFVGKRPTVGVTAAAKSVADAAAALVRAEIAAAKAQVEGPIKAKAQGAGLFVGAAVLAWLGIQGLLVTIALLLALVLPGWAAALIVTALLLGGAAGAALVGRKRVAAKLPIDRIKSNVAADVAVAKTAIPRRADGAVRGAA